MNRAQSPNLRSRRALRGRVRHPRKRVHTPGNSVTSLQLQLELVDHGRALHLLVAVILIVSAISVEKSWQERDTVPPQILALAQISFAALLSLRARHGLWRRFQSQRFSACDGCFLDWWRLSGSE